MDILQLLIYGAIIFAATPLLGGYMARVFAAERTLLAPLLRPIEASIYRLCGIDREREQHWTGYAIAVLAFNAVGWLLLYALLRLQHLLPWNPQHLPPMAPDLAFNTAVSFVTNTNWQAYGGETHAQLLQPDGRPDGGEFRLRRHRHGGRDRRDPRLRRPSAARRQLLVDLTRSVLYVLLAALDLSGA